MAEPWVLVPAGTVPAPGHTLGLEAEEGRHLARVLRRPPGSHVTLCDGRGVLAAARIASVRRDHIQVEVVEATLSPPPAGPAVDLALAVLHSSAMDWAVQKAVEVGVRAFLPVIAERSQVEIGPARRRVAHWARLSRQALKQCRRAWEMEIADPVALRDLVARRDLDQVLTLADPAGGPMAALGRGRDLLLLVGPEGGFTDRELELLGRCGGPRVRLGRHVLRAETAAVVGAALLVGLLGGELDP